MNLNSKTAKKQTIVKLRLKVFGLRNVLLVLGEPRFAEICVGFARRLATATVGLKQLTYPFWEYDSDWKITIICSSQLLIGYVQSMNQAEKEFRQILADSKVTEKAARELWKWYDPSEKKGVASY